MLNERSLNERFLALEKDMSSASCLLEKGKANEIPFFIFDYNPKDELNVRNEIKKIKRVNPNIIEYDLFEMIIELLEEEGYLEDVKTFDKEYDSDLLLANMFQPFLSLESDNNPLLDKFKEKLIDDSEHIILITGVGKSYPIIRSHTILNKLQPVVRIAPVVMMYPGRYNQKNAMCLKLFDCLEDDNYYRAFPLEERIEK